MLQIPNRLLPNSAARQRDLSRYRLEIRDSAELNSASLTRALTHNQSGSLLVSPFCPFIPSGTGIGSAPYEPVDLLVRPSIVGADSAVELL